VKFDAEKCEFWTELQALRRRVIDNLSDVLCGADFSIQKMGYSHVCSIELIIEYN